MKILEVFSMLVAQAQGTQLKGVTMDFVSFFANKDPVISEAGKVNGAVDGEVYPCLLFLPPDGVNSVANTTANYQVTLYVIDKFNPLAGQSADPNEPNKRQNDTVLMNFAHMQGLGDGIMNKIKLQFLNGNCENSAVYDSYRWSYDQLVGANKLCYYKMDFTLDVIDHSC